MRRPTIVCLCGSTRFYKTFEVANLRETLAGKIVLSVAGGQADDQLFGAMPAAERDATVAMLAELHRHKIDLADEVLILNVDGYIGRSTEEELRYALSRQKSIRFWEPTSAPAWAVGT